MGFCGLRKLKRSAFLSFLHGPHMKWAFFSGCAPFQGHDRQEVHRPERHEKAGNVARPALLHISHGFCKNWQAVLTGGAQWFFFGFFFFFERLRNFYVFCRKRFIFIVQIFTEVHTLASQSLLWKGCQNQSGGYDKR